MVACGRFSSVRQAAQELVRVKSTVEPDRQLTQLYDERYDRFRRIYPTCKNLFAQLI